MSKPIYKKWWFIAIIAVVVLVIIALIVPEQPGSQGREVAKLVSDSLKKCLSQEEIANWYNYANKQMSMLKNKEEMKAYSDELERLSPSSSSTTNNDKSSSLEWIVGHFVDSFGEKTKDAFITTSPKIKGTFSNTATTDSELEVKFLISDSTDISIKLFEYAGDNPVKAISSEVYNIQVKDNDGEIHSLSAINSSDRLTLLKYDSPDLHKILLKGGVVKFRITTSEYSTSEYKFDIENASGYSKAYEELKKEEK